MWSNKIRGVKIVLLILASLSTIEARADGGFFSESRTLAISADQRVILIKHGEEVSMTLSTGYSGEGEDFAWIIPVPVPPAIGDVREAGRQGTAAFDILDKHTAPVFTRTSACFPSGTEVLTADGLHTIETVAPERLVRSYDVSAGAWVLKRVLQRHVHQYEGDIVSIGIGDVAIRATGNHPFYVLRGERLTARPLPQDVPIAEQQIKGEGRWVEARDLAEGDVLLDRRGMGVTITAVQSRDERAVVYNLEVEGSHTYAVHSYGIVVHNKAAAEEPPVTRSLVTVYGTAILKHYEVSILGASALQPLLTWLRRNGYQVVPSAGTILDAYVREGWAFVAIKLIPGERRHYEDESLPPVTIQYHYGKLVFPLRISAVSTTETAAITLYVIADSTVTPTNLPAEPMAIEVVMSSSSHANPESYLEDRIDEAAGSDGGRLVVLWKGKVPAGGELRAAIGELMNNPFPATATAYLTRLEARMGPEAMTDDIHLGADFKAQALAVSIKATHLLTPWRVPGVSAVTRIAGGRGHTSVLKDDGTAWSWGVPELRGDGTDVNTTALVRVRDLSHVVAIDAADDHTVALEQDGTVWAWGENKQGELGDGTTTARFTPVKVRGLAEAGAVAAGYQYTVALQKDGTVWTWGYNNWAGQLGDGTTVSRSTPRRVSGLSGIVAVAAGSFHVVALREDGTVWAWGTNDSGELGDGTATDRSRPVQVRGISDVVAIAAGHDCTFAVRKDGTVWAWGLNHHGELGDGTTTNRSMPVQVKGLSEVIAVSATGHTIALSKDGTVWAWGYSHYGQLGDGTVTDRSSSMDEHFTSVPVRVQNMSGVVAIAAGDTYTLMVRDDGTVWASGLW